MKLGDLEIGPRMAASGTQTLASGATADFGRATQGRQGYVS
jgi:hypothetical protein